MKALVCNVHGLGDLIQCTPIFSKLAEDYTVDLLCREGVVKSGLMADCPYIDSIYEVPYSCDGDYKSKYEKVLEQFNDMASGYDWSGHTPNDFFFCGESKVKCMARELKVVIDNYSPEVFINDECQLEADEYLDGKGKVLFLHNKVPRHSNHDWPDALNWAKDNLIFDYVHDTSEVTFENINTSFAVLKDSECCVLSSSVFVHAADAMKCYIDCVNYGSQDRKVFPIDCSKILRVREMGEFLERDNPIFKMYEHLI